MLVRSSTVFLSKVISDVKVDWLTTRPMSCCDGAAAQLTFGIELGLDCEAMLCTLSSIRMLPLL